MDNWIPTEQEYNPGIDKEQWLQLINDNTIFTDESLIFFACLKELGQASCLELSKQFGRDKQFYNSNCWQTGKRVHNKTKCPLSERENGNDRFWSVCCLGKYIDSGQFIYRIRPELLEAFEEIGVLDEVTKKAAKEWIIKDVSELQILYESFLKEFPIERLKTMTIEEYNNTDRDNSFCYWIETKLKKLGGIGGASSYKFGIYKYIRKPLRGPSDETYAWSKKYGDTATIAYEKIRENIVSIAEFAKDGHFSNIDKIDISTMFKWKIAFLYSNLSMLNIFSEKALREISKNKGFKNYKKASLSDLYKYLISIKEPNTNILIYASQLWNEWINSTNDKNTIMNENVKILLNSHNLILTGAPGTGKTYLAKEIAAQIIFNGYKAYSPELEKDEDFKHQYAFVQFHPSYDYTDFVEGLRPTQPDENGNIGFERKDGVFKEFCKRALENYLDSQKSIEVLQKEKNIKDLFDEFINDAIENENEYKTITNNKFFIKGQTEQKVIVEIPQNEKVKELGISVTEILEILNADIELNKGKEVSNYLNRKWRTQQDSYIFAIAKEIKELQKISKTKTQNIERVATKPFVFIIDEINRGEISKIFGELFFSIDPGYRGKRGLVKTQYQNIVQDGDIFKDGFFVPENVYIIGTMNDIDRSVESMDFAFRRRFAWKEIKANDNVEMLKQLGTELKDEAKKRMESLNKAISETDGLDHAYHIGASYFLKLKDLDNNFDELWKYHLEGLLREYLRGRHDIENEMKKLEKAYGNVISKENKTD